MANQEFNRDLCVKKLNAKKINEANGWIIEKESSKNAVISKCLAHASKDKMKRIKKGDINKLKTSEDIDEEVKRGRPDIIISRSHGDNDYIFIGECKGNVKEQDNAEKEAVWYAGYLAEHFNVILFGSSGEEENDFQLSTYFWKQKEESCTSLILDKFLTIDEYLDIVDISRNVKTTPTIDLLKEASNMSMSMHNYADLDGKDKSILVAGILIGLDDELFRKNYCEKDINNKWLYPDKDYSENQELIDVELRNHLVSAIMRVLAKKRIPIDKRNTLKAQFNATIGQNEDFAKIHGAIRLNPLRYFINEIYKKIYPRIKNHETDIVGEFYQEFIKYGGGDKGLGIVLTPYHVAELFAELADLNTKSICLDICTGTGAFLVAAMNNMIAKAETDKDYIDGKKDLDDVIADIKDNNLIGIEKKSNIFTLAIANMIVRNDGHSHIFNESCFNIKGVIKPYKPTVGFVNPPYAKDDEKLHELKFVEYMLDNLEDGGIGIAIVPMSKGINNTGETLKNKEQILKKHTLLACMTMNKDLFANGDASVNPLIMVFEAGKPHYEVNKNGKIQYYEDNKKGKGSAPLKPRIATYFADWKDDGFYVNNGNRIEKNKGDWANILATWKKEYAKRITTDHSLNQDVIYSDEWCWEKYAVTDYNKLVQDDFEKSIKNFAIFKLSTKED